MTLIFPGPGAVIDALELDVVVPTMLMRSCGQAKTFYCAACKAFLANTYNVGLHIAFGEHQIVTWCTAHKLFEPITADQRAEIEQEIAQLPGLLA